MPFYHVDLCTDKAMVGKIPQGWIFFIPAKQCTAPDGGQKM